MPQAIHINLPVATPQRSIEFLKAPGFSFNSQFTNDQAAARVIPDAIWTRVECRGEEQPDPESPGVTNRLNLPVGMPHQRCQSLLPKQEYNQKRGDHAFIRQ
jgi:hypothetical protein